MTDTDGSEKTTECYVCRTELDIREDEWWQHSWEENPARETVEKAIEETEFRDWVTENKVLCSDCHKEFVGAIEYNRRLA